MAEVNVLKQQGAGVTIDSRKQGADSAVSAPTKGTGNIRTGDGIKKDAVERVHTATEQINGTKAELGGKPTIDRSITKIPESIGKMHTTTTSQEPKPPSYSPSIKKGGEKAPAMPQAAPATSYVKQNGAQNIQTASQQAKEAESRVKLSTGQFYGTKAVTGENKGITTEAVRTPHIVDAAKTQTPLTGKIAPPQGAGAHYIRQNGAQNIQTASEQAKEAERRVKISTEQFYSTKAVTGESRGITTEAVRTPHIVDAVRTGGKPLTGKLSQTAVTPSQTDNGMFRRVENDGDRDMPYYVTATPTSSRIMVNGTTGSLITQAQRIRVANQAHTGQAEVNRISITGKKVQGAALQNALSHMSGMTTGLSMMQAKTQESGDLGTGAIGESIALGQAAYLNIRAAQVVSDHIPQITKAGSTALKATYQVGTAGKAVTLTLAKTTKQIYNSYAYGLPILAGGGVTKLTVPQQYAALLKQNALATGLNKTEIAKKIATSVQRLQTAYVTGKAKLHNAYTTAKRTMTTIIHRVDNAAHIVRRVATGQVSAAIVSKNALNRFRQAAHIRTNAVKAGALKTIRRGYVRGGVMIRNAPKNLFHAGRSTLRGGRFAIGNLSLAGTGIMTASDDVALQGVGNTINLAHAGIKTATTAAKMTGRTVGYTVRTSVKTVNNVRAGYAFIKNNGLRAAWMKARTKIQAKIAGAGKSAVTAVINLIKGMGTKLVVPLLLIVVVVAGFNTVVMVPVQAVGSFFSGIFSIFSPDANGDYVVETETEVVDYLTTYVPPEINGDKQRAINTLSGWIASTNVEIVRFYSEATGTRTFLSADTTVMSSALDSALLTEEQAIAILQPVYNSIVMMNYELTLRDSEAIQLVQDMYRTLVKTGQHTTTEYCNDTACTQCGYYHAHPSNCLRSTSGSHTVYTCSTCDSWSCPGHNTVTCDQDGEEGHEHSDDCYTMSIHTNIGDCTDPTFINCTGYKHCVGHRVKTYTIEVNGAWPLINDYFQKPIEQLSVINPRTDNEQEKLDTIKDYFEIFWESVNQLAETMGVNIAGSYLSTAEINGLDFEEATRPGNWDIINNALAQLGQRGGQPYWSNYGFSGWVNWDACFVEYIMRNTPSANAHYPTNSQTGNNAGCVSLAAYFKNSANGYTWASGNETDLAAGDIIFLDWEANGNPNHIGLVIGRAGNTVYTIEGNSGDAVRINAYAVGDRAIYGYVLMSYQ